MIIIENNTFSKKSKTSKSKIFHVKPTIFKPAVSPILYNFWKAASKEFHTGVGKTTI